MITWLIFKSLIHLAGVMFSESDIIQGCFSCGQLAEGLGYNTTGSKSSEAEPYHLTLSLCGVWTRKDIHFHCILTECLISPPVLTSYMSDTEPQPLSVSLVLSLSGAA